MKKVFLTAMMSLMLCIGVFAQDYLKPPKANERVLGTISISRRTHCLNPDNVDNGLKSEWHFELLEKAKKEYPGREIKIRELQVGPLHSTFRADCYYYGPAVGKVVYTINPEEESQEKLIPAINKALLNVPKGSKMAIDNMTVTGDMDKEKLKDQLIDVLLEKDYRVVAKEYLQKLYSEQQDQLNSGLYNPDTTVEGSKFSAVGYFINVKVTETSMRVQVVNVSTGEYEGNATVNF
ncbi:MAG: hypothetical protein IJQ11_07950 [Bacteroidales bacterium]|nr:hypothetical protein [Bacteroidales bacterium]